MSQPNTTPAAVGIDIGSFQSVIAVYKKGMPEVITNEANFRQTPNIVGFSQSERYLGETGQVKLKANYRDTVTYITRFLGLPHDSSLLSQEKRFITAQTETSQGGRFAFRVNYRGESQIFLPEEVVGAFISKLKSILELNKLNKDQPVVFSVPSYWNAFERKALLDAAGIANQKVIRLLNDSTAIALDHYMSHKEELTEEPKNILLVDFGHSKLSLTVVSFSKGKIKVLAQHHQKNAGCRDIDILLLEFYRQHMLRTQGVDLYENKKAVVKLVENIEKQRKVLSANSDHSLNMQYLIDDHDLTYTLKRQEFEKIAEPVFTKCFQALQKIMHVTTNQGIKLSGIEMIGGGTRIPAFIKLVQNIFKIQPARTVNSSESIAKGCAYMAANKNPNFRNLEISIEEQNYNQIEASWKYGVEAEISNLSQVVQQQYPKSQSKILFETGCVIPSTKELKIETTDAVQIVLGYEPEISGFHKNIALFTIGKQVNAGPSSINIKFTMDQNGFVVVESCQATQQNSAPTKLSVKSVPYVNLTDNNIKELAGGEQRMLEQDKSIEKTYELKNKLQAHVYATKEKLKTTYKDYIGPGELEQLENKFEEITNWIYNADLETSHHDLLAKRQDIDKVLEPILAKIQSHEEFAKIVKESKEEIVKCARWLRSNERKYAHISLRDRQAAMVQVDKFDKYIENAVHLQNKAPKSKPLLTPIDEIKDKLDTMKENVEVIMNQPAQVSNLRNSEILQPTYNKKPSKKQRKQQTQPQYMEEDEQEQQEESPAQPQYEQPRNRQSQYYPRQEEQYYQEPQYRPQQPQYQQSPYNPFDFQDPFFGGYRSQGYPAQQQQRQQRPQQRQPQQSRYQQPEEQYYEDSQRYARRPRQQQNSFGFNPFGGFFGGW